MKHTPGNTRQAGLSGPARRPAPSLPPHPAEPVSGLHSAGGWAA